MQNGNIPRTSLLELLNGQYLLTPAARAVLTAVKVAHLEGITIDCPHGGDKGISGYRDLARQALFVAASHGNKAAAARCNMDPNMKTSMGAVGYQSHGYGDRIDLLFDGHSPDASDLALMGRYGAIQEFGSNDSNHFWVHKPTTTIDEADKNRIVARFLNGQHLGKTTTTDQDGLWPEKSNFSWMLQEYGAKQHGWYPQPAYKIDGDAGTRTHWVRDHLFNLLWSQ